MYKSLSSTDDHDRAYPHNTMPSEDPPDPDGDRATESDKPPIDEHALDVSGLRGPEITLTDFSYRLNH